MMFNEQVLPLSKEVELTPPSKWHFLYWLKWFFIVKPKLIRELSKAQAQVIDEVLRSDKL